MTRRFARKVEDFACTRCGTEVAGDGYTNHCPRCLWSLHVDVDPGDRAADCGGAMRPVRVELKGDRRTLVHVCGKCGAERRCRTSPADDRDALLAVAREAAEGLSGRTRR